MTLADAVIDSIDATVLTATPTIPAVAHLAVAAVVNESCNGCNCVQVTPFATMTLVEAVIDTIDTTVLTAVPTVAHLTVAAVVNECNNYCNCFDYCL
jgi:hypothetical protein